MLMDRTGEWLELSVETDPEAVEAVSEVLARYGYQGGVVIEEAQQPAGNGVSLERDPGRPVRVRTYIHRDAGAAETVGKVQGTLTLLGRLRPVGPVQVRALQDKDWGDAWKQYYPVLPVSERIVVVPAWRRFRAQKGQVALRLDPGMAFGTGLHPTTQLCLQALEVYLRPDARVLDLGTGSGILAIAAVCLGAGPVLALDTDPIAVQAARRNIQRNRQSDRVEILEGTLQAGMGPFDLILANLLAQAILDLAGPLARSLDREGVVIASGVLIEQADEVAEALEKAGLCPIERPQQGDWVALVARR